MNSNRLARLAAFAALLLPVAVWAQTGGLPALTSTPGPGGSQTYTLSIQTLLTISALTFIPAALLMMTSFTRIIIVLSLLRHALGTQTSPPNQVLVGLALFLTFFVMSPVFDKVYVDAYQPFTENRISFNQALELARPVADTLKKPIDTDCCLRIRHTAAQANLPWRERAKNIRGAFHCTKDLSGTRVLLVDDVMTTGASLNECARTLKLHGADEVTLLVLARALL